MITRRTAMMGATLTALLTAMPALADKRELARTKVELVSVGQRVEVSGSRRQMSSRAARQSATAQQL